MSRRTEMNWHQVLDVRHDPVTKQCLWYSLAVDDWIEIPRDLVHGILDMLSGYGNRKNPPPLPVQYEQEVQKRVEAARAT